MIKTLAALLAVGVLTGCSATPEATPVETSPPQPVEQLDSLYPAGQLISIESSNVAAAGYDPLTRVMTVQFLSGGLYEYYEVPESLWLDFLAAQPSPWSQVGYPQLVEGGYAYRRIG